MSGKSKSVFRKILYNHVLCKKNYTTHFICTWSDQKYDDHFRFFYLISIEIMFNFHISITNQF